MFIPLSLYVSPSITLTKYEGGVRHFLFAILFVQGVEKSFADLQQDETDLMRSCCRLFVVARQSFSRSSKYKFKIGLSLGLVMVFVLRKSIALNSR